MSDNKGNRRSVMGSGYYIALILCAAAIGITGYLYYRNQAAEASVEDVILAPDVPVPATRPRIPKETRAAATQPTQAPTQPPEKEAVLKTAAPIRGDAVAGYSMEALSYNQTTRDWRTHNGMDLAAGEGTQVLAAARGTVYSVYEDEALGHTVVIRHPGGYTSRYSSLGRDIPVKAGQTVALGDVIGYAGTSALVETVLGPHVHFSVSHRDRPLDPADFLAIGK